MRRTRIKGIANIPQRKKVEPPDKTDVEIKHQPEILKPLNELKNVSQINSPTHTTSDVIKTSVQHVNADSEYPQPPSSPIEFERNIIKAIPIIANRKINFGTNESDTTLDVIKTSIQDANAGSNCEYPQPPSSPNKLGKGEVNAIPTIENMNISFSASESDTISDVIKTSIRQANEGSGCEHPPPSSSLKKLDRSRIKAIPTIANRTISFGASESDITSNVMKTSIQHANAASACEYPPPSSSLKKLHRSRIKAIPTIVNRKVSFGTIESDTTSDVIKTSIQQATAGSDCEYPPPSSSPKNLERSRIKAIPTIANRKVSFGTSESDTTSDVIKTSIQQATARSDCEYPPPPLSPNKLERSRVKAIPTIVNRKISFSASESDTTSDIIKTSIQHANAGSDCEYPPPPLSPNKINRSRIKAIPKIGNRKISFSASESEDESKKHDHRVRHDSQSSNFSTAHDSMSDQPSTLKMMEFSSVIQRKCKRTEWSRKLADARREFTRKFMSGKPDHKKLTMIDLIFYNPTTNVMKNEEQSISNTESKLDSNNDEDVDDPTNKSAEDSRKSDEENEVPAPQIRIGPSGEIIIDEKSLVIENKQTTINREQLQRSKLIDGNGDRPYGVYKKVKRSKDWTHSETLRFYKALSTIGTDFTLMCELFPNRTRRELKMKFKKEEKINQILVDKAVMEPCSFDFEELKKEFELVEIERKELEKQRIEEQKLKKTKGIKKSIKFLKFTGQNDKHQTQTTNSVEIESDDESQPEIQKNSSVDNKLTNDTKSEKKQNKPKIPNYMKKHKQNNFDIMSVLTNSDSSNSGSEDSEVVWKPVQTRYGRKTRKRQIYEPETNIQEEELIVPRKISKPNLVADEEQQKPGSLMMISSKAPDGQPVVQIFMVTDKKMQNSKNIEGIVDINTENLLPIAMIKTGQTDDEGEEMIENNYTIPAEPENQNIPQVVDVVESIDKTIEDSLQT